MNLEQAKAEIARLRAALQDFADHGTRHDLCPTRLLPRNGAEAVDQWWLEYFQGADRSIRQRAAEYLTTPTKTGREWEALCSKLDAAKSRQKKGAI